jgi:RTX calcium-binding nonapeptide repeat (4 copies)
MFGSSSNSPHLQNIEAPLAVAIPGVLYSYHFQLSGDNVDALEVQLQGDADWLTLEKRANGDCVLYGVPTDDDVQASMIQILVVDPSLPGTPETFSYELAVKSRDVNLEQSGSVKVVEAETGGGGAGVQTQSFGGGSPVVMSMESIAGLSVATGIMSLSTVDKIKLPQSLATISAVNFLETVAKAQVTLSAGSAATSFVPPPVIQIVLPVLVLPLIVAAPEVTEAVVLNVAPPVEVPVAPDVVSPAQAATVSQSTTDTTTEGGGDGTTETTTTIVPVDPIEPPPPQAPPEETPVPTQALFTEGNDGSMAQPIDFNNLSTFSPEVFLLSYDALGGNDFVNLPNTDAGAVWNYDYNIVFTGGTGNDTITGGDANDMISGGPGDDVIDGGLGNDWFVGSTGLDVYLPDAGDTLSFASFTGGGISVGLPMDIGERSVFKPDFEFDLINELENFVGTAFDDRFGVWDFNFNIDAGPGSDTIALDFFFAGTNFDLDAPGTFLNFENVIGTFFNDTLSGDGNSNIIDGGGGVDTITADGGNDTIIFDQNHALMDGGTGSDSVLFNALNNIDLDTDPLNILNTETIDLGGTGSTLDIGEDAQPLRDFSGDGISDGSQIFIAGNGTDTVMLEDAAWLFNSMDATHTRYDAVFGNAFSVFIENDMIITPY